MSTRVIIAPITSSTRKLFSFEVAIEHNRRQGKVLLDQIRSVDKIRVEGKITSCDDKTLENIDRALKVALALS